MSNERQHWQFFVVAVPAFGDPDTERDRIAVRLGRAMHHQVKPGCALAPAEPLDAFQRVMARYRLDDPFRTLDPKGDDMGNHEGHPDPLVPIEVNIE